MVSGESSASEPEQSAAARSAHAGAHGTELFLTVSTKPLSWELSFIHSVDFIQHFLGCKAEAQRSSTSTSSSGEQTQTSEPELHGCTSGNADPRSYQQTDVV